MKVNVHENPKKPGKGLALEFPYHEDAVKYIKNVLGVTFDKPRTLWVSDGPEILLDMQRFGIEVNWMSTSARTIAEGFRQQLWDQMDARAQDIEEYEYAYQDIGAKILAAMPFMILGDEPGLGKSKQSLDAAMKIGVSQGAYRRIPTQSRTNETSSKESRNWQNKGSAREGSQEVDKDLSKLRNSNESLSSHDSSYSSTRDTPETSSIPNNSRNNSETKRQWPNDESVYSKDGEYTSQERLHKRVSDKDEGPQYRGKESSDLLQSGLRQSSKDDSDRIRQQNYSQDWIQEKRPEEIYSARGFRLESVSNKTFPILILCPKTLCFNWVNEVHKWWPELTVDVVPDQMRTNKKGIGRTDFWHNMPDVVIANYEKLRLVDWPDQLIWDVMICDEATKLKNAQTVLYKVTKRVMRRVNTAWALTGTPLEIRVQELYNILGLLRPAVLGGWMRFESQHVITDWSGAVVGSKNLELLRERIAPFLLRRTKGEVLRQLPPKRYNNVLVKMSPEETAAYQSMTSAFNNWLDENHISGGGNPLVETLRMRQFCASPAIWTDEFRHGSKFEMLKELIEGWDGLVVVFCFFEEVISLMHKWLNVHPEALISGKITSDKGERIRRAEAFSAGEMGKVFLSTDAGGMGINITGADLVIHYDQLFNPQKMHQREDRLHRIGQTKPVVVANMLCLDTIDVGMYQLNKEREHLFEEIVDGAEEALLRKLDAPRLKRLVEGRLNNERLNVV